MRTLGMAGVHNVAGCLMLTNCTSADRQACDGKRFAIFRFFLFCLREDTAESSPEEAALLVCRSD
jgi:hypothetical protein